VGKQLLHIIATPRGLASNTGRISSVLLEALQDRYQDLDVRSLDLFSADLPAVAGTNIETKYALMTGQPVAEDARASWRRIEQTIEEFLSADLYVLTTPMWNFGVPYALKYYIDAIVQPGYLFEYDELGQPRGLVNGRRMVCVTSRGGDYSQAPMMQFDFLESYLRAIFGFVGIADLTFFNVQPTDITADLRRAAMQAATREVRSWVQEGAWDGSPNVSAEELPADLKPPVLTE
jgi:FMN-dependent NADH-azoreductase